MNNTETRAVTSLLLPDFVNMNAVKAKMRLVAYRETLDLEEAVREKLVQLLQLMDTTERTLADRVVQVLAVANSQSFESVQEELAKIHKDATLSVEVRSNMVAAFQADAEHEAQHAVVMLKNYRDTLRSALSELERFKLIDTAEYKGSVATELKELSAVLEETQRAYDIKSQEKMDLDIIVNAFSEPSVSRLFNELIPTEDEIDKIISVLTLKKIDADLLKSASKKFKHFVDLADEGRKYSKVVVARDKLGKELTERKEELETWKAKHEKIERQLLQWGEVDKLVPLKQEWLADASKVSKGLSELLEFFQGPQTLAEMSGGLMKIAIFFGAIRKRYENA